MALLPSPLLIAVRSSLLWPSLVAGTRAHCSRDRVSLPPLMAPACAFACTRRPAPAWRARNSSTTQRFTFGALAALTPCVARRVLGLHPALALVHSWSARGPTAHCSCPLLTAAGAPAAHPHNRIMRFALQREPAHPTRRPTRRGWAIQWLCPCIVIDPRRGIPCPMGGGGGGSSHAGLPSHGVPGSRSLLEPGASPGGEGWGDRAHMPRYALQSPSAPPSPTQTCLLVPKRRTCWARSAGHVGRQV